MNRMFSVDGQAICRSCLNHLSVRRLSVIRDSSGRRCSCCQGSKRTVRPDKVKA